MPREGNCSKLLELGYIHAKIQECVAQNAGIKATTDLACFVLQTFILLCFEIPRSPISMVEAWD